MTDKEMHGKQLSVIKKLTVAAGMVQRRGRLQHLKSSVIYGKF